MQKPKIMVGEVGENVASHDLLRISVTMCLKSHIDKRQPGKHKNVTERHRFKK